MFSYVARRLLLAIPTLFGVMIVTFVAMRLLPGDPARMVAGLQATPAEIQRARINLGLNEPLPVQFVDYLSQVLRGNLGISSVTSGPVTSEIGSRLPYTVALAAVATTLSVLAGVPMGVVAALRRDSWIDSLVSGLAVIGLSVPVYALGLILIIFFAVLLHFLPAGGSDQPTSIVLPALTLAAFSIGLVARMTRASLVSELLQDYVRTAQAKGAGATRRLLVHVLRNALLPVITVVGLQFGQLLGGAVLTETVFSWPGVGQLLVRSILDRDYNVVQGVILVFAALFILVNILVDLSYGIADPRVRFE